jgi:hypothetical protein
LTVLSNAWLTFWLYSTPAREAGLVAKITRFLSVD